MILLSIYALFFCISASLLLMIFRANIFDKMLLANFANTSVIILIVLIGEFTENDTFVDVALAYAFISFIATIAIRKFFLF